MPVYTQIPCCCDRCKAPWCAHAYGTLEGSFTSGATSWSGSGVILNKRIASYGSDVAVESIPGSTFPAGFINSGHAENPGTIPTFGLQIVCETDETPPDGYTPMRAYLEVSFYPIGHLFAKTWLTSNQINGVDPIEFDLASLWSGTVSAFDISIQLEPSRICDGLGCCCQDCQAIYLQASATSETRTATWDCILRKPDDPLADPYFSTAAFSTMLSRSAWWLGETWWSKSGDDIYSFSYDGYGHIRIGHWQVTTGTGVPVLSLFDQILSNIDTIDDCPQNLVASNFSGTLGANLGAGEPTTGLTFTISCSGQPSCSCPANLVIEDTTNDNYLDGPYVDLEPGDYCVRYVDGATKTNTDVDVTAGKGYMTAILLRSTVANFANGTKQLILRPFAGVKATEADAIAASTGFKQYIKITTATRIYGIVRDLPGAYGDNSGTLSWAICTGSSTLCPGFDCGEDGPCTYDISGQWWLSEYDGGTPVGYAMVGSDGSYVVTGGVHDGESGIIKCCGGKIYFLNPDCTIAYGPFTLTDSGNYFGTLFADFWCRTGHCP